MAAGLTLFLIACTSADANVAEAPAPSDATVATTEAKPSNTTSYSLVAAESEARYRVREQLLGQELPGDAVGRTKTLSGAIALSSAGAILPEQSKFSVDLRTLRSSESRRDNYIQGMTLQTRLYPLAEFVPSRVEGLESLTPPLQESSFQLVGDLTIHGVTRPATWQVSIRPAASLDLAGTASTDFALTDFGITPPRAGPVLSIENKATLELDFMLRQATGGS
jgi:polyisoprenoid-binding protein YceI